MEAVKSGHSFSSTSLTKIDAELILFSDVMAERAGMHKTTACGHEALLLGTCHLFLAVVGMWQSLAGVWARLSV